MHYQFYNDEEEFEPRVVPKPIAKRDLFIVPTVPEVSLIFEKSAIHNSINESTAKSPTKLTSSVQISNDVVKVINPMSPISHNPNNPNSYAAWKKENYSRDISTSSTTCVLPLCRNSYHALPLGLQNSSAQKQQEQDKINDKQEKQRTHEYTTKVNDTIYEKSVKFKCSNTEDFYDLTDQNHVSSSDKKQSSSHTSSLQRTTLGITKHTETSSDIIPSDTLKKLEHFQTPYEYQQSHALSYPNCNVDNNETVKTLLQLVNSQNEQIKNLQLQVDRLVRMQEENFKNKSSCLCSQSLTNQVLRYPINCYDTALSSTLTQSHNQGINKNIISQNTSVIEKKDLENLSENNKSEIALEQQSKKTFMEQKVSIGVMTSFEFTVQNSPFFMDSEIYEKKETHKESSNINTRNTNIHDTAEPINRYKNTFTRKPAGAAQLENIVEDSESYLSSSQQQSSNLNANSSMKEFLKMYQHLAADLSREEMHKEIYIGKDSNMNKHMQNARKISNASMNVDHSSTRDANYNKALEQTNDYRIINNGERNIDETNIDKHPTCNIHLPVTDYYNHKNKEYDTNIKRIKDIGDSMILSGGDLKVFERPPPTPEPSIHVEMQEYMSDDESDKLKHTSKIGWTFYNNVLGQVNEILQNSGVIDDKDLNDAKTICNIEQENDVETRTVLNPVKAATLEQLQKLGISLTENNEHKESNSNKTLDFDSSYYPRLDCQANMIHSTSVVNETNTSMHMKALALKYLSDEQLADIALHKQESSSLKHFMLSNMQGTDMSFATMRYLERYQLLPGKNNQIEGVNQIHDQVSSKHDFKLAMIKNNPALRRCPFVQTSETTCPSRILELSTLKRQPKLL
ncbi:LOW QUALITY PROTEIN: uncharacterized protein LOC105425647 [Pogonomyrmex barbatus]|uniref:LOW QUALITY PROTEIN: uncharacterized protein LOC105425647 n=1 Tax=Pogonomyrmex barbatus TaxID=144034 RepID=A0A6I9VZQ0_9HYME|nr:LOW QUALITY PROTEIN: uncharacterized protein LOC105425647 [Pogonomyrmex barbatus]